MFCTKCGKDNVDGNKFCIECGQPLKKPAQHTNVGNIGSQQETGEKNTNPWQNAPDGTTVISEVSSINEEKRGSDLSTTLLNENTIILVDKKGTEYLLDHFPMTIGKGSAADCILPGDETISRVHATIHEYNNDKFVIEDMNSSNKTYLNDNVVEPEELVLLNDGDKLKLGKSEFTVKF